MSEELLFPEIEPFNSGFLQVSPIHKIYYEESGNPSGLPVVMVHGGPGDCSSPKHRRRFDPEKCRIILFDQRGAGQSLPSACLEENTTDHLVADMEKLRQHLAVDRWLVVGSSWGSTLSLVYAQAHPAAVLGMVLNGIFLGYRVNTDWIHGPSGAARIFPEHYDDYINWLPEDERSDPFDAYTKRIHGADKELAMEAAQRMLTYEGQIMAMEATTISKNEERAEAEAMMDAAEKQAAQAGFAQFAYSHCLLETHYAQADFFLKERQILDAVDVLKNIPITLIHGRYDLICPIKNAYKLNFFMPHSRLVVVSNAGHGTGEMLAEVMAEIDKMVALFT
ncbi:MAG: prolyl aminopeptidase [Magnetococcales bacterium]|nr:prolyl aminopeptidase [Magnetococcales bacterium]|tara:strand:- start:34386 stop:35393 length:1008 start_codon:yes stop_codon:yes gene_type:complete